jgi:hypothetical protein
MTELTYNEACNLSIYFHQAPKPDNESNRRINEFLKEQIMEAKAREHQRFVKAQNEQAAENLEA